MQQEDENSSEGMVVSSYDEMCDTLSQAVEHNIFEQEVQARYPSVEYGRTVYKGRGCYPSRKEHRRHNAPSEAMHSGAYYSYENEQPLGTGSLLNVDQDNKPAPHASHSPLYEPYSYNKVFSRASHDRSGRHSGPSTPHTEFPSTPRTEIMRYSDISRHRSKHRRSKPSAMNLTLVGEIMKNSKKSKTEALRYTRSLADGSKGTEIFLKHIKSDNDIEGKSSAPQKLKNNDENLEDNYEEIEMELDLEKVNEEDFVPPGTSDVLTTVPNEANGLSVKRNSTDKKDITEGSVCSQPSKNCGASLKAATPSQESIWSMLEQPIPQDAALPDASPQNEGNAHGEGDFDVNEEAKPHDVSEEPDIDGETPNKRRNALLHRINKNSAVSVETNVEQTVPPETEVGNQTSVMKSDRQQVFILPSLYPYQPPTLHVVTLTVAKQDGIQLSNISSKTTFAVPTATIYSTHEVTDSPERKRKRNKKKQNKTLRASVGKVDSASIQSEAKIFETNRANDRAKTPVGTLPEFAATPDVIPPSIARKPMAAPTLVSQTPTTGRQVELSTSSSQVVFKTTLTTTTLIKTNIKATKRPATSNAVNSNNQHKFRVLDKPLDKNIEETMDISSQNAFKPQKLKEKLSQNDLYQPFTVASNDLPKAQQPHHVKLKRRVSDKPKPKTALASSSANKLSKGIKAPETKEKFQKLKALISKDEISYKQIHKIKGVKQAELKVVQDELKEMIHRVAVMKGKASRCEEIVARYRVQEAKMKERLQKNKLKLELKNQTLASAGTGAQVTILKERNQEKLELKKRQLLEPQLTTKISRKKKADETSVGTKTKRRVSLSKEVQSRLEKYKKSKKASNPSTHDLSLKKIAISSLSPACDTRKSYIETDKGYMNTCDDVVNTKQIAEHQEAVEPGEMRVWDLARKAVLSDNYNCIKFLRENQLLAREMNCPNCRSQMTEEETKVCRQDGYRWRCKKTNCRTTVTIRKGSFFERSSIGLMQTVLLIYFWATGMSQQQIAYESEVSEKTVVDRANFLREICSSDLATREGQIGGPGHIVTIGKTQVPKRKKGKNARGRTTKPFWLFGGVDHSTKKAFIKLVPEQGRTAPIMERLITGNIAEGTTIWSDSFASYKNIVNLRKNYVHKTVNNNSVYVTEDGVHTNHIKSLWADIKLRFRTMRGVSRSLISSHLDEWLWRKQYPKRSHFVEILKAIARNSDFKVNRTVD